VASGNTWHTRSSVTSRACRSRWSGAATCPGLRIPYEPFNFTEFEGTGTVKGIHGNREDGVPAPISFFARAEDRNEPGSNGAKDGAQIDRYFIHAWSGGTTWLLVDGDGNPVTIDPVPITDGNLQIHISSCSVPSGN
jgi:hypothetical protein